MTEELSFPRQYARTQRFTLGAPRAFTVSPDGGRVVFLRSRTGLMALSAVMVLVQSGDALIGAINHDLLKTLGPVFLALLTAGALIAVMKAGNKLGDGSNEFAP